MKKVLLVIGLLVGSISSISSQEISDNAIGLKFNDISFETLEITYQRKLSEKSRLQLDTYTDFDNVSIAGFYQRVFKLNDDLNWYGGVGASYSNLTSDISGLGTLGIEYNFESPIMASLEVTPINVGENGFNWGSGFSLAVRYQF